MPRNYVTTVMVHKSDTMKLGEPLAKKGVEINITPTKLQLVFLKGPPDKEIENFVPAHLRVQIEKKNLIGKWKPAEPRY
ncbi:hypothetical protein ACHAP8_011761 [Fusarium lateritium]